MSDELNIKIFPIESIYIKKLILNGKKTISYSLINKANNEEEFLAYIKGEKVLNLALTYGIQAHSSIIDYKVCVDIDIKNRIDKENNKVYLSYNDVSETIIMKYILHDFYYYKIQHVDKLQYEKQIYAIIEFKNIKFLIKAYIDAYNESLNTIIEFKTTSNIFNLKNTIYKYNYDLQAYLYTKIINAIYNKKPNFEFFFLNKQDISNISYMPINDYLIISGEKKFKSLFIKTLSLLNKHKLLYRFQI
ncbi:hypothetical protein IOLA_127 [uncultured bacterium]|nr:hypothetical protein IOLA_127 [uncultured bacterium]